MCNCVNLTRASLLLPYVTMATEVLFLQYSLALSGNIRYDKIRQPLLVPYVENLWEVQTKHQNGQQKKIE